MKTLGPIVIGIVMAWMMNAMAATMQYGKRATAEVAIQNTESGVDAKYIHGSWCIDSRSF